MTKEEQIIRDFLKYPKSKGVILFSDDIAEKLITNYIKELKIKNNDNSSNRK